LSEWREQEVRDNWKDVSCIVCGGCERGDLENEFPPGLYHKANCPRQLHDARAERASESTWLGRKQLTGELCFCQWPSHLRNGPIWCTPGQLQASKYAEAAKRLHAVSIPIEPVTAIALLPPPDKFCNQCNMAGHVDAAHCQQCGRPLEG
jgi:ferredoxin